MKKNSSVEAVKKAEKTFGGDNKKLIRELERLVRAGKRAGDYLMVGAAYCRLAEACNAAGDLNGIFTNALKAVALLKDSEEYELIARSYSALGQSYTNQENHLLALIAAEKKTV